MIPSPFLASEARRLLEEMFHAAIRAADPMTCVPRSLPEPPKGRTIVVGAGKAAASMARAVETNWNGALTGLVVTRYGHSVACERIEVVEAAHPVPDAAGRDAAARILASVRGLTEHDLVLCLFSGGGSALLTLPAPGISLADKQSVVKALLNSGANISEMNCVRKHLSAIKGGRLALASEPARLVSLLISDVPGDDSSVIASGPTVADPTTFADAAGILEKYGLTGERAAYKVLQAAADETPKPGDPRLARAEIRMVATPQNSLEAAAEVAQAAGVTPLVLGASIEGEAKDVALVHAGIARQVVVHGQPTHAPCVLISGGETTVTVRGKGRGGRNAEFLLALTVALNAIPGVYALAGDTDGIDGTEDNAGAIATPDSLARGERIRVDARARLRDNDGYGYFSALGDLVVTGPTLTNVNDFRAILVTGAQ